MSQLSYRSSAATGNTPAAATETAKFATINKAYLKFLLGYAKPYRKTLLLALVVTIALASLRAVLPFALKRVSELFLENDALSLIVLWMGIGLGSVTVWSGVDIIGRYLLTILHVRLTNDMREDLYEHIQNSPLQFHLQRRSGELGGLLSNDVNAAASGVVELFNAAIMAPASILFLAATMLYFNPLLSLLAIGSVPLVGFFVTRASKKARRAEFGYLEEESRLMGALVESLVNVKQVKSFGLGAQQKDNVHKVGDKLVELRKKAVLMKASVSPAGEILNVLALLAMALIAYYQLKMGKTTHADIVGCLAAAFAIKSPVKALSNAIVAVQRSVAGWQRISWVIDSAKVESDLEKKNLNLPIRQIELRALSFAYDGRTPILADVDLTVRRGERLAVLGHSGAGKTTLVDLLMGLYPASSGNILIDGENIKQINMQQWRRQIGIVTQEPFLFSGSIEDNIRHGFAEADEQRIQKAAHIAGCDEMLRRLPGGLKAGVGERGNRLSGGERKRIALARAIVRPISVLLLDEATSELDPLIENEILTAIDRVARDLIVIHVSHRPSLFNHCDRAIVLEKGALRELRQEDWPAYEQQVVR